MGAPAAAAARGSLNVHRARELVRQRMGAWADGVAAAARGSLKVWGGSYDGSTRRLKVRCAQGSLGRGSGGAGARMKLRRWRPEKSLEPIQSSAQTLLHPGPLPHHPRAEALPLPCSSTRDSFVSASSVPSSSSRASKDQLMELCTNYAMSIVGSNDRKRFGTVRYRYLEMLFVGPEQISARDTFISSCARKRGPQPCTSAKEEMRGTFIDYSKWEEVKAINSYALFMGYMSMAVRGMGYLVVLWTTVVLLGGFVSVLEKKDFWCLAIITLVQTVGVSTVFPSENLKKIVSSYSRGFVSTTYTFYVSKNSKDDHHRDYGQLCGLANLRCTKLLASAAYVVQQVVFAVVAGPLVLALTVLYVCGLVITTGLAAWRLRQRDYGGGGGDNLWPALDVLYTLVLLQGVLSYYRFSSRLCEGKVVHAVAEAYRFDRWSQHPVLHRYIRETRIGCEKDPSFAKRTNLVRYALDTMDGCESPNCARFVDAANLLHALLENPKLEEHHSLIKEHLVWSPSSGDFVQKLVQSLDSARGYHPSTRMCAARMLSHLAGDLSPDKLNITPVINSIAASLLEAPGAGEDKGNGGDHLLHLYEEQMVEGLNLLAKLAAADDDWCHAIAEKDGLLHKIMQLLCSGQHRHINYSSSPIARGAMIAPCIQVMRHLVAAPGVTGEKMCREISGNMDAMARMESILNCHGCNGYQLIEGVVEIYTRLRGHDPPSAMAIKRGHFIMQQVRIFTQPATEGDKNVDLLLAGEMLAELSSHGKENTRIILQAKPDVVGDLTGILQGKTTKRRIIAAQILEQLCTHHTDDEYLQKLKEHLIVTVPKVLAKTLRPLKSSMREISLPEQDRGFWKAVLSLSVTMLHNLMNDQDFAPLFDAIATEAADFSFLDKLQMIVHVLSWRITINELKALKHVAEIFILVVEHGSPSAMENASRLRSRLLQAANRIWDIENIMVFGRPRTDSMQYQTYFTFHGNIGDSSRSGILDMVWKIRELDEDKRVGQKLDDR
ncbi:uncharacterized protein LOC127756375 [Oryza glaberrima]|uniref:uncharacterized protein LOC127756375 n=1 Tax=Oryza glaberrima TaxID=4538 RepID=UPI00224C3368|nr:uncharacterized protein LOC127756375 [Oryza glaberrima]